MRITQTALLAAALFLAGCSNTGTSELEVGAADTPPLSTESETDAGDLTANFDEETPSDVPNALAFADDTTTTSGEVATTSSEVPASTTSTAPSTTTTSTTETPSSSTTTTMPIAVDQTTVLSPTTTTVAPATTVAVTNTSLSNGIVVGFDWLETTASESEQVILAEIQRELNSMHSAWNESGSFTIRKQGEPVIGDLGEYQDYSVVAVTADNGFVTFIVNTGDQSVPYVNGAPADEGIAFGCTQWEQCPEGVSASDFSWERETVVTPLSAYLHSSECLFIPQSNSWGHNIQCPDGVDIAQLR